MKEPSRRWPRELKPHDMLLALRTPATPSWPILTPRSLRNRLLLAAASHVAKPPEACPRPPLRSLPPR